MSMVELAFAPAAASQSEEAREAKLKAAKQKVRYSMHTGYDLTDG